MKSPSESSLAFAAPNRAFKFSPFGRSSPLPARESRSLIYISSARASPLTSRRMRSANPRARRMYALDGSSRCGDPHAGTARTKSSSSDPLALTDASVAPRSTLSMSFFALDIARRDARDENDDELCAGFQIRTRVRPSRGVFARLEASTRAR